MEESDALYFFAQLLLGLAHMHDLKIMHRDLKTENILFTEPLRRVKIIDFGLARATSSEMDVFRLNPNNYTALENKSVLEIRFKSDVWSSGVILYEVAMGLEPNYIEHRLEEKPADLPLDIKTICRRILIEVDPDKGPDCNEVLHYSELKDSLCKYFDSLESMDREIVYEQINDIVGTNEIDN